MKNDLIRRSDAIKAIANDGDEQWWYEERINEVPAVDAVEVVHAKWVDVREKRLWGEQYFLCSRCKSRNGLMIKFNYCPNCGARMDGE